MCSLPAFSCGFHGPPDHGLRFPWSVRVRCALPPSSGLSSKRPCSSVTSHLPDEAGLDLVSWNTSWSPTIYPTHHLALILVNSNSLYRKNLRNVLVPSYCRLTGSQYNLRWRHLTIVFTSPTVASCWWKIINNIRKTILANPLHSWMLISNFT